MLYILYILTGLEGNLHFVNCILGLLVRRQQFGYKGLWQNAFCPRNQSMIFLLYSSMFYILSSFMWSRFDYRMILEMSVINKLRPELWRKALQSGPTSNIAVIILLQRPINSFSCQYFAAASHLTEKYPIFWTAQ